VHGEKLLKAKQIEQAQPKEKVYRLRDGGGLFLLVRPDGHKYFQYRYTFGGKERLCQIGAYPAVSLEAARAELDRHRRVLMSGKDPVTERRVVEAKGVAAAATTFEAVATEWLTHNKEHWSAHHHERNEGLLKRILFPQIGKLPIDEVPGATLLAALRACEKRGRVESARRARAVAEQVFAWAIGSHMASNNPATGLGAVMKKTKVKHFDALPRAELGNFVRALRTAQDIDPVTRSGLGLMLLTALRDHELRAAQWREFDIKAGVWTIPAERMKRREPHSVPLPSQALAILEGLRPLTDKGTTSYVFASSKAKSGYMAENTMRLAMHRLGFKVTVHGLRSLLTDTLNEMDFRPDWVEAQLHHAIENKVTAAYKRTGFLDQRKGMMAFWADYCDRRAEGLTHEQAEAAVRGATVVPINSSKAA